MMSSDESIAGDGDGELTPFELLHGHVDEVIAEWRELVQPQPWVPASPARLLNSLPEILPRLFHLGRRGASHIDQDLSDFIAQAHGSPRREDDVPIGALAEEWNHLKRACWTVLQRHESDVARAARAMQRLDALMDDAIGYSLRGYYRPELDSLRGRGLERRAGTADRRGSGGDRRRS